MIDPSLRELYQEIILDYGRNPRHFGTMEGASHEGHGHNPLCGDRVTLYLKIGASGRVEDIAFEGKGCAISMASASMMTDLLLGRDIDEARALASAFYRLARGEAINTAMSEDDLDRLGAMSGVSQFPMRVKCATLAWHTFEAALEGARGPEPSAQ